jgi:hypothetical protein
MPEHARQLITALSIGESDSAEIWEIDARHAWIAW